MPRALSKRCTSAFSRLRDQRDRKCAATLRAEARSIAERLGAAPGAGHNARIIALASAKGKPRYGLFKSSSPVQTIDMAKHQVKPKPTKQSHDGVRIFRHMLILSAFRKKPDGHVADRNMRRGRVALFEISCTATFKENPIASAISATVRRVRLRPPAKSCDTNPLVLPRRFATSDLVSPRFSMASDNASVTSRISEHPKPARRNGAIRDRSLSGC